MIKKIRTSSIRKSVNTRTFNKHGKEQPRYRNISNLRPIARTQPYSNFTVHCWNANRIRNKTITLVDHVIEYDVDIMVITETWLAEDDSVVIGECKPPGYEFLNFPRGGSRQGGGIGILYKKTLNLISSPSGFNSVNFEHCIVTLKDSIQFIASSPVQDSIQFTTIKR